MSIYRQFEARKVREKSKLQSNLITGDLLISRYELLVNYGDESANVLLDGETICTLPRYAPKLYLSLF